METKAFSQDDDWANAFIIRDIRSGVLISLKTLLDLLPPIVCETWRFRQMDLNAGSPFGMLHCDFLELTLKEPDGFCATNDQMNEFVQSDIQVIDGEIDAVTKDGIKLVTIECFDSSLWVIHTSRAEYIDAMEKRGFKRGTLK